MQKRILLTGGNGLLGQKIVKLLADRLYTQLLATGRGVNRHILREGYEYVSLDLTDSQKLSSLFKEYKPTHLIHTAASTLVDKCELDQEACDAVNVQAVEQLCKLSVQYGTHLVHISTDFVFDGEDGPYKEEDVPNPVNYYGRSKLKAERIVQDSGAAFAILRTMLLYGVSPAMSRSNIVLWVKKSLESGTPIKVVDDQKRCPTLAEDLAIATVSASMKNASGIYHISGAEMMSMLTLAHKVADFWKLDASLISPIDSVSLKQAAKRPPITGFVILKAQTELGYKPFTLNQGLGLVDRQLKEWKNMI